MSGRIVDGPTAAQLRASLEHALDAGDSQDQGELLVRHQRDVMLAIAAGVQAQRSHRHGVELGDPAPSGTVISEQSPVERAWWAARAQEGL